MIVFFVIIKLTCVCLEIELSIQSNNQKNGYNLIKGCTGLPITISAMPISSFFILLQMLCIMK